MSKYEFSTAVQMAELVLWGWMRNTLGKVRYMVAERLICNRMCDTLV